jgi:hypothetical protein
VSARFWLWMPLGNALKGRAFKARRKRQERICGFSR